MFGSKGNMKMLKSIGTAINFTVVEISGWLVLILTLLVSFDVLLRYIFKQSIPGAVEISQVLLTFMVYLILGAVQEKKDHIRIDFFIEKLPVKIRRYWEVVISIVGVVFFSFLFVYCWESFLSSYEMKEFYGGAIRIPIYPGRAAIVVGIGLMVVALLKDIGLLLHSKDKAPILTSVDQREIDEAIEREEALERIKKK
jgi:TRAP-type C4-dicarboxylate transport system permease small subunit